MYVNAFSDQQRPPPSMSEYIIMIANLICTDISLRCCYSFPHPHSTTTTSDCHVQMRPYHLKSKTTPSYILSLRMHLVQLTALTSTAVLAQQIDRPLGIERAVSLKTVLQSAGLI